MLSCHRIRGRPLRRTLSGIHRMTMDGQESQSELDLWTRRHLALAMFWSQSETMYTLSIVHCIFSLLRRPASSHVSSSSLVYPTTLRNISRRAEPMRRRWSSVRPLEDSPYTAVGVTTASNRRRRSPRDMFLFPKAWLFAYYLAHAHSIR